MDREIIYLQRDNAIDVLLKSEGSAEDLSGVSQIDVVISGVTMSSASSPALFSGVTATNGIITLKFGSATEVLSSGKFNAEMIVYDSDNINGVVWGEIPILVKG